MLIWQGLEESNLPVWESKAHALTTWLNPYCVNLAGADGFEPPFHESESSALTAVLRPYMPLCCYFYICTSNITMIFFSNQVPQSLSLNFPSKAKVVYVAILLIQLVSNVLRFILKPEFEYSIHT